MHADILGDIAVCMVTATVFAFVAKWTRQPLILAYILAGVVVGSTQGFGWVTGAHQIETVSELGLILLLFMIGLEIDLKKLKSAGKAVAAVGIGQFLFCVALGLLFAPWITADGWGGDLAAVYLAVGAALSSTMIVVKLLYDKFELDTLAGRMTLGVLIFQDIWAILFLAAQPNLQSPDPTIIVLSLVKGAAVVLFALAVSRYVLPVVFRSIAKQPELVLIGALGWCFGVVLLSAKLGLSREMGALIAGVSISTFPYNLDVAAKVITLRDFFITLFFVTLGAQIPLPDLNTLLLSLALSGFIIVSRFLSITPLLHLIGYGHRASILPAVNLSQISEFSLVIAALGVGMGHIEQSVLSVIVFTLAITSVTSTYAILYNDALARVLQRLLTRAGIRDLGDEPEAAERAPAKPIVFLGFYRTASSLLYELLHERPDLAADVCVVDFNPAVKKELDRRGIHVVYGDISNADTLHHANIHAARVIVCTIPDSLLKGTTNRRLLRKLPRLAAEARLVVTAEMFSEAREMYDEGAAFVFMPRFMGIRELKEALMSALQGDLELAALKHTVAGRGEVLP